MSKTPKSKKKDSEISQDPWQENMHIALQNQDSHEAMKLSANGKLVSAHDNFVEYIRHIESKLQVVPLIIHLIYRLQEISPTCIE